jgi:hypothetical protein
MSETTERVQDLAAVYRRAFDEYATIALWNLRPVAEPTRADALALTRPLRTHGGIAGRRLAEEIESLCLADR